LDYLNIIIKLKSFTIIPIKFLALKLILLLYYLFPIYFLYSFNLISQVSLNY